MFKNKRGILLAFAAIMGVAAVLGVSAFKNTDKLVDYNFNLSVAPSSESAVETLSNWIQQSSLTCSTNMDQVACSITVPENLTEIDLDTGERVLKSTAIINASEFATGKWFVSSGNYTNRYNKAAP